MKNLANYFIYLFKKYDLWVIYTFIFLLMYSFHQVDLATTDDYKFVIYIWPLIFILLNLGNMEIKVNMIDVLSIVAIFVNLYFVILNGNIYSIIMTLLLFAQILYKGICYKIDGYEESRSKIFFSRLNYRFPLVALFFVGFSLSFIFYYVLNNTNEEFHTNFYYVLRIMAYTIPIFYLILTNLTDQKKLNVFDYLHFVFICFILGGIVTLNLSASYLTLPFLALFLRANSYEAKAIFRRRSYVSSLLEKYHILFPFLLGFVAMLAIHKTYPNAILGISQPYVFIVIAIGEILLVALTILFGKVKAKDIVKTDYVLAIQIFLLFFSFIYILSAALGFIEPKDNDAYIFKHLLSLLSLSVFACCFIFTFIFYFLRYKNFDKHSTKVEDTLKQIMDKSIEESFDDQEDVRFYNIEIDLGGQLILPNLPYMEEFRFEERMMYSSTLTKQIYSKTKNYLLSYGFTSRILKTGEEFDQKELQVLLTYEQELIATIGRKEFNLNQFFDSFMEAINQIIQDNALSKLNFYEPIAYDTLLMPSGKVILKGLGYDLSLMSDLVNAKSIPEHFPDSLLEYIPRIDLNDDIKNEPQEIYLDTLCNLYHDDEIVSADTLKKKKNYKKVQALRVKGRGTLNRRFVLFAEDYDELALKMILLTDSTCVLLKH